MNFYLSTFLIFFIDAIACKSVGNPSKRQNEPQKSVEAYDQRQSGKYNIHINVKDVQLIKLDGFKIGDDYSYGDYGDYPDTDYDYDVSNLTTSPIWAHLGSSSEKPSTSTKKPKITTQKTTTIPENSDRITSTSSTVISEKPTTSIATPTTDKISENSSNVEMFNESEDKLVLNGKPDSTTKAPIKTTTLKINNATEASIDYEEIPVQVIYERRKHNNNYGNQQKKGGNGRKRYNRRPSIEVIEPHSLKHHKNVEIMDSAEEKSDDDLDQVMNICGHNEVLDALGRCRTRRNQYKQGM